MKSIIQKLLFSLAFFACGSTANAQLPNEKFGKPSSLEWDYVGWGDAVDADAIILCKTMKVSYQISDQLRTNGEEYTDLNLDNLPFLGKNMIDEGNVLTNYEFNLRTKILKPEGAKHANIDITYYDTKDGEPYDRDELTDLKIKVFTKNEKGKVEKRNINTASFVKEHIDDNYMVIHVVVPDVQPGSIIEYQYKITSTRSAYLYDWAFQECIPTVRSKCDMNIPAFLQFDMNVPINKLVKSNVEAASISYDTNRSDFKQAKSCRSNHYTIVGDYILPEGHSLKHNSSNDGKGDAEQIKIANFTSRIKINGVAVPTNMPNSSTHLKVK